MQLRQGDVFLESCEEPDGLDVISPTGDRIVLAEGEATGHAHVVSSSDAILLTKGAERYLRVVRPTGLKHEEHQEIQLPSGTFKIIRQRTYTPQGIRNVED